MQLAAFLCVICAICGRITRKRTLSILHKQNPNISPADLADNADKPQNYKTTITTPPQTVFLCGIMQLCCIPLRNLRHLRENIHIRVLKQSPKKPQCIPQIYADETQNHTNYKLSFSTTSESCIFQQNTCIVMKNLLPLHH